MTSSDSEQSRPARRFRPRASGWALATLFGLVQVLILAVSAETALRHVRAAAGSSVLVDSWLSPAESPYLFAAVVVAGVGFVAIGILFDLRVRWRWYGLAALVLAAFVVNGASGAERKIDGFATADGAGFVRRGGPVLAFHRWETASQLDIACRIGGSRTPNRILHVDVTFADGNVAALQRDLTNDSFPAFLQAAEAIESRVLSRTTGTAPIVRRSADGGCEERAPAALRARLERLTGTR